MFRIMIPGALIIALLTAVLSMPAPRAVLAQDNLPSLGRSSSALSELDEKRLGRQFIRQARRSMNFVDDPELTQYISDLGARIASHSAEPGSEFRFT